MVLTKCLLLYWNRIIGSTDGVDYVPVKYGDNANIYMPVETDIMIEMAPNTHTRNLEEKFDPQRFASGRGYKDGFI